MSLILRCVCHLFEMCVADTEIFASVIEMCMSLRQNDIYYWWCSALTYCSIRARIRFQLNLPQPHYFESEVTYFFAKNLATSPVWKVILFPRIACLDQRQRRLLFKLISGSSRLTSSAVCRLQSVPFDVVLINFNRVHHSGKLLPSSMTRSTPALRLYWSVT